jgi:Putative amidoligase enzyme
MTSPALQAYRCSPWREQVQATWAFLADHYRVHTNEWCSTHVHVSVSGGYSLRDIKNIAQCALHFEPAVEVLVPAERRYNYYSKGNWINNRNLAGRNLSRIDSIAKIEACENKGQLISLMHPGLDRYFGWNFWSLNKLNTIEFRKGAGSRNADEALAWAELAMTFVQSAMKSIITPDLLRRIPPNIRGLQWFLLQDQAVEGISDPRYLAPLFADKLPHASVTPLLYLQTPADIIPMLERKIEDDRRRNAMLARSLEVPSN